MRYRFFCQIVHLTTFQTLVMLKKNLLVRGCTNEPAIGDYVLVEFKTFPRKYYVGRITKNKDFEGDYEISCMRKKRNVTEFFPEVTDLASVKEKDIRAVLPAPMECRSTSRQRSSLKFDYDKSGSILMHRHAFAFSFSAHFFVICCCSKLFGCFFIFWRMQAQTTL